MQFATAANCKKILSRNQQRVDFKVFDPWLFRHELAETNQYFFERRKGHRTTFVKQSIVELALLKHPACKSGIQRRQTNYKVAVNIRTAVCRAKHQHRTKLRIDSGSKLRAMAAVLGCLRRSMSQGRNSVFRQDLS